MARLLSRFELLPSDFPIIDDAITRGGGALLHCSVSSGADELLDALWLTGSSTFQYARSLRPSRPAAVFVVLG
jgi:hypothetical protein